MVERPRERSFWQVLQRVSKPFLVGSFIYLARFDLWSGLWCLCLLSSC